MLIEKANFLTELDTNGYNFLALLSNMNWVKFLSLPLLSKLALRIEENKDYEWLLSQKYLLNFLPKNLESLSLKFEVNYRRDNLIVIKETFELISNFKNLK